MTFLLTPAELQELTNCRRSDAQVRVLDHIGIPHARRPDGSLLVLRSVTEVMLGGTPQVSRPEPQVVPEPELYFGRTTTRRRIPAGG